MMQTGYSDASNLPTEFDIAVVGGGPSGTATAITCAQNGLRTLLLDCATFPRDRPGETLHPGVEALLTRLGVLERVEALKPSRHRGHWVKWGQTADYEFQEFGKDADGSPWRGYHVWRAEFDAVLLDHAASLGVQVLRGRAVAPIQDRDRVIGLTFKDAQTKRSIQTKYLVDAAGGKHWLARHLCLPLEFHSPRLIMHYGYVDVGDRHTTDTIENIPFPQLRGDTSGWEWFSRVREAQIANRIHHRYQWMRLQLGTKGTTHGAVPKLFQNLTPYGAPVRSADVTWRTLHHPTGLGYICVGDAAGMLDPSASHGVLRALLSGIIAANTIRGIIQSDDLEQHLINKYNLWWKEWLEQDLEVMTRAYAQLAQI